MLFLAWDRIGPPCDTIGQPEANRDEPNGCVYVFHMIFLSVFVGWFVGEPPGSLSCSTARERQKLTMANAPSVVDPRRLSRPDHATGFEIFLRKEKPQRTAAVEDASRSLGQPASQCRCLNEMLRLKVNAEV
jgi:hypothetical protein